VVNLIPIFIFLLRSELEYIKMVKYVFLTGGVISSLGKGTTAASLGALFIARGIKTTSIKIDGYLNVDAGLMSPYEHGEVFVTKDGAETDCDIGHYERFLHTDLTQNNNLTSGKIYLKVLDKERKGYYLGKTVQIIPHVSNEIQDWIKEISKDFEIVIVELGGVAGEVESIPFLDAMRQIWLKNRHDVVFVHLALLPHIDCLNEYKTKPVQHSVRDLLSKGVQPDIIICRTKGALSNGEVSKISMFTNVEEKSVFYSPDVNFKYQVIEIVKDQQIDLQILEKLKLLEKYPTIDFAQWEEFLYRYKNKASFKVVKLAFIRKYTTNSDNYVSLVEAVNHAAIELKIKLEIEYIDSDETNLLEKIKQCQCVLIPGGWGSRGTDGKIEAIRYARQNNIPFLGICLGFQLACIEYATNELKLEDANSIELKSTCLNPIIIEIKDVLGEDRQTDEGLFSMPKKLRVGARRVKIVADSFMSSIYQKSEVSERFRHRYSFNLEYKEKFEARGMKFGGYNDEDTMNTMECLEIPDKDFFVAIQYHPEFLSRPFCPHPIFVSFLSAASKSDKKEL
jgi:CTP synthase